MHPDVQHFLDAWQAKSAAKQEALVAVGAAKFADFDGRPEDAAEQWAIVEAKGFSHGEEGRLYAEAVTIAEAYVKAHPDEFKEYEEPEGGHEGIVKLVTALRRSGFLEASTKLVMYELATYERQQIGGTTQVVKRKAA